MTAVLARRDGFAIDNDPAATDLDAVCSFLARAWWSAELPRATLEASVRNALVWNLRVEASGAQVGFARAVTDCVRFGWLSDVFVLEPYRGRGLGAFLLGTLLADPRVAEVERWLLATRDVHPLYRRFGFVDAPAGRYMVRTRT